MRWSYKTVHYELKKEGLLGGAFLDESEVELSLNEFGKAGWELVAMVDTADGLIAVFKQPIGFSGGGRLRLEPEGLGDDEVVRPLKRPAEAEKSLSAGDPGETPLLDDFEVIGDDAGEAELHQPAKLKGRDRRLPAADDIGTIKIE